MTPRLPPAVVVHGAAQRDAALRPGRPVLLLSAPGAGCFAGAGWWRALTQGHHPAALDCGDDPGRALEALEAGPGLVILHPCPSWPSVAVRVAPGRVLASRPPALDLGLRGAERRLDAWLGPADADERTPPAG